jgi:WD40 repeat protein
MSTTARPPPRHPHVSREEDAVIRSYFHLPPILPDHLYHDDVCFSADGSYFAVTSNSTVISLFKTDGCQGQSTIPNKKYGSTRSTFHPKHGTMLYLNSGPDSDHSARLLDMQVGSFTRYFKDHTAPITSLAAHGTTLITASLDRKVHVWDELQKAPVSTISPRQPSNVALHPNGRCLALASSGSLSLYDMRNLAAAVRTERTNANTDVTAHFGMRGKGLLVAGRGFAAEYCLTDLSVIVEIADVQDDTMPGLAYGPDESFFCVPAKDNTIVVYDSADGELVTVLAGHDSAVSTIAFCPAFHNLVSAGQRCLFWTVDRGTYYALWPS